MIERAVPQEYHKSLNHYSIAGVDTNFLQVRLNKRLAIEYQKNKKGDCIATCDAPLPHIVEAALHVAATS